MEPTETLGQGKPFLLCLPRYLFSAAAAAAANVDEIPDQRKAENALQCGQLELQETKKKERNESPLGKKWKQGRFFRLGKAQRATKLRRSGPR